MMADLGCIALFRNVDDLRVFRVLGPRPGHCQHHDDYGAYQDRENLLLCLQPHELLASERVNFSTRTLSKVGTVA